MKKERTVKKNYEFSRIISKRKFVKTNSFILYYQPKAQDQNRIGISVGKKLGNAVTRNKVKRQVRAMIDEVFDFQEDFDCILIVRPGYTSRSWQDAKDELVYSRRKACNRKRGKE